MNVTGCWSLTSVETKAAIGTTEVQVYIEFASDKTFSLYQMLGEGRYSHFSGTWKLAGKTLDGTYSDGKAWGSSYEASKDGANTLVLTSGTGEVSTYTKIDAIPAEVLGYSR